jgi:hypothetical protein
VPILLATFFRFFCHSGLVKCAFYRSGAPLLKKTVTNPQRFELKRDFSAKSTTENAVNPGGLIASE